MLFGVGLWTIVIAILGVDKHPLLSVFIGCSCYGIWSNEWANERILKVFQQTILAKVWVGLSMIAQASERLEAALREPLQPVSPLVANLKQELLFWQSGHTFLAISLLVALHFTCLRPVRAFC